MFNFNNLNQSASRIDLDVSWLLCETDMYTFLDARLENELYVTIGLREENKIRYAQMSIMHDPKNLSQVDSFQKTEPDGKVDKDFISKRGGENDYYYKGNYQFKNNEIIRLSISTDINTIEGYLYSSNYGIKKIGSFITKNNGLIRARRAREHTNGFALEKVGQDDPCDKKCIVSIKHALRVDTMGRNSIATQGQTRYQKCPNSNIESLNDNIIISHGGNTTRLINNLSWINWS